MRNDVEAFHTRFSRAACGSTPPSAGCCGPRSRQTARRLVLRAFRATAPAELQELLRDEGVAAVQTLPSVTRQQLLQLWQDTLQLVQGGSGLRQRAALHHDADAMPDARTPSA